MSVIADLIRAGVDPDLVAKVAEEMIEAAKSAAPARTARQDRNSRYYEARKERLKTSELDANKTVKTVSDDDAYPAASDSAPTRVVITNLPSEDISLKTTTSWLQKTPVEKQKSVRGSRLPADWMPDDAGRKLASELLGNSGARLQLEKFRDWAAAAAGAKGVKADWGAAWRNWVRTAAEESKSRAGPDRPQSSQSHFLHAFQRISQDAQRDSDPEFFSPDADASESRSGGGNHAPSGGSGPGGGGQVLDYAAFVPFGRNTA